jgi:hypothetical protein
MKDKVQRDIDLEEIFSHVQRIKEEQITIVENRQVDLEPLEIIKEQTEVIAGDLNIYNIKPEDIFEIVEEIKQTPNENLFSIGNLTKEIDEGIGSVGICDICHKGMLFERNLSGLVIQGKFFACEECCQDATKELLDFWAHSKNVKPEDIRPIAFWLMEKENKTRLVE